MLRVECLPLRNAMANQQTKGKWYDGWKHLERELKHVVKTVTQGDAKLVQKRWRLE